MATILIVDDSAMHRRLAGTLMEKRAGASALGRPQDTGWTVLYAAHGQEALEAIERDRPDIVLTDLLMPGMDGLELVERIKQGNPSLPVILMTGHGSEDVAVQALNRGAASYVPKHKLPKELLDTAESILAMSDDSQRTAPADPLPLPSRPPTADDCWIESETYFCVPNDLAYLSPLVARLQANLRQLRLFGSNDLLRVCVAVREALSNAIVHGNLEISAENREADPERYQALIKERRQLEPYRRRRVHLFVHETANEVRYRIRDEGPGFPHAAAEAASPANLNQDTGRGLRLIKSFMDEVRHNERGNEVTLVKRRASAASPIV
jgi:CheY-like chemotaxis protein